jgi:glucose/mannose-6-phosphate isomerase
MLGLIEQMPKHLTDGRRRGRMSGLPRFTPKQIAVCGVGGSAIGGDILCEWLSSMAEVPCRVNRDYTLPPHVNKDTLLIVASYSGNTEESLSMLEDARKKRAKIVAISSGGQLAKICESESIPLARLPSGLVPRSTLGYMFGTMVGILERSGVAPPDKQMEETVRILEKQIARCGPTVSTQDNPAKKLAHELLTPVPVIVGYGLSRPVARRWANQLSENGKTLAFSSELPEMNHNEIVGWIKDAKARNFAVVVLDHDLSPAPMLRRVAATKEMIGRVAPVYSVESCGKSPLARIFSLVIVGDFVSAYVGILRRENPSTNEPIDELKVTLSRK